MATYLDKIISDHRESAKADIRNSNELMAMARDLAPCKDFQSALSGSGVSIIAEIKRMSPSKGHLNLSINPAKLAKLYQDNGAACISVLTDKEYFLGSLDDLRSVRESVALPLLRKDFTVSINDVIDARLAGADAILLIVAALSPGELEEFAGVANELGLAVLVEVHGSREIDQVRSIPIGILGVNQRDLFTFEVDPTIAISLASCIPSNLIKVCESGISEASQISQLLDAKFHAALIGETLVKAGDPAAKLRELVMAGVSEGS